MSEAFYYIGWEAINIALEYTAIAWAELPRKLLAVTGVNLLTHPLFMLFLSRFGRGNGSMALAEIVIFLVEWLALIVLYGRARWRYLGAAALTMNAVSLGVGLMVA